MEDEAKEQNSVTEEAELGRSLEPTAGSHLQREKKTEKNELLDFIGKK